MADYNSLARATQQAVVDLRKRGAGHSPRYVDDMIGDILLDHGFMEEDNPDDYDTAWTALCIAAAEIAPSE